MKRNRHLLLRSGLLMAVLSGIAPVIHAASVTTTLPITVTVATACTVSATGVNFGTFTGPAINANGSITVTCANGTTFSVALNAGDHFGVTGSSARNVVGATGALAYRLFKDSTQTTEWGDTCVGGAGTHSALCFFNVFTIGVPEVFTVYGRLEATPSAPPSGTYSDTVLVTVIF